MPGDPADPYSTALQLDEEQHVVRHQAAPSQHFRREEIGPGEQVHVRPDELLPSRAPTTRGRRRDVVSAQDIANGLVRQVMAQVGQCAYDAVVAPARVLTGKPYHEGFHRRFDPRSAGYARYREPSNLWAMSRWYHPRMVSGFA